MEKFSRLAQALKSQLKGPKAAIAALSLVLICTCAAAVASYAQGQDPLAALEGALHTTAETQAAIQPALQATSDAASDDAVQSKNDAATGSSRQDGAAATTFASATRTQGTADGGDAGSGAATGARAANSNNSDANASASGTSNKNSAADKNSAHAKSASNASATGHAGGSSQQGGASAAQDARITVSVTIDGSAAGAGAMTYSVKLAPESTAYDALIATGTSVNARATAYGTYVAAIGGLAEKEHGASSGWVYAVGGVEPQTAASNYVLNSGDQLVWTYVNVTA